MTDRDKREMANLREGVHKDDVSLRPASNIESVDKVMTSNASLYQFQHLRVWRHHVLGQTCTNQLPVHGFTVEIFQ